MEALMMRTPRREAAVEAVPDLDPEESRWGFEEGDLIVSGRSAIRMLGGGFCYEGTSPGTSACARW